MKIHSINARFLFFIAATGALCALALAGFIISSLIYRQNERYHRFLDQEKDFAKLVIEERAALRNPDQYQHVIDLYTAMASEMTARSRVILEHLVSRRAVYADLHDITRDINRHENRVTQLLPSLIESVRYIHEHHIAYLKNMLRRGHVSQDYDIGPDFQKSAIQAAPELDIIGMAVSIQNRLLDLSNLFTALHLGDNPSALKDNFQKQMSQFYKAVNAFEDYSLDAQDGLLVEELLMNGRQFETAFNHLLAGEIKIQKLSASLEDNAAVVLQAFVEERKKIADDLKQRTGWLHMAQFSGAAGFLFLVGVLMFLGRQLKQAFRRTVLETEHIQADIDYRIPVRGDDYAEFRVVYLALNAMADTIKKQVDDLAAAGSRLSQQVQERTAGLEHANRLLKREIKEREAAEAQRIELEAQLNRAKKMEAIGTLAGGVAHDLNNILCGLVSYPDLILTTTALDHAMRSALETIKSSGEKAAAIVQDLLTLARRGVNVAEAVDLQQIAEAYFSSPEFRRLENTFPHVCFMPHYSTQPAIIRGSRVHLEKTLMNLVTNAAEAIADRGTVSVSIDSAYIDTAVKGYDTVTEGDYVRLTVSDDGAGISEADLERIFEPFFTKKEMGRSGTGLGMAVVWGTVKDHNGYIDVDSSQGRGTTFTLYFPQTRTSPVSQPKVDLERLRGSGQVILVVDDIAEQRHIAVQILNQLGYRADSAADGEAAVRYVAANAVDLLILDMIMSPGMDGLDTYKQISALRPGIRAIIASGFSETNRVRQAQALGVGGYVRKPYTLEAIAQAVWNALSAGGQTVHSN